MLRRHLLEWVGQAKPSATIRRARAAAVAPAVTLALALGTANVRGQSSSPTLSSAATTPGPALASPAILKDLSPDARTVEVQLTAAPRRLSLVPATTTDVYAYNGQVPGPTLVLREGDRVIAHFRNDLPVPTTIHWHGLHIPASSDGSPFHPVAPGAQHDYVFTILPGSADTYWYHPHPHHTTGYQVAKGLYGAIVIRAPDDPLPASLPEKLLILADNRNRPIH